jgi:hypothetical protein
MSLGTAFVVIVAIICMTELIKAKYRARHGITRDAMGNETPAARESTELQREVEELRERIKVLERIATEDTEVKRLSSEIDSLRGQ